MKRDRPSPLAARGIEYGVAGRAILRPLDLALHQGELLGLVGPNGSGKSTLLRLFAGLLRPAGGRLLFRGEPYAEANRECRSREIAYIPQKIIAHWPISVEQTVALGRLPHLAPGRDAGPEERRIVEAVMAETDVDHLSRRAVDTLSGGELARVAIARALATRPDLILADEPTAALDPSHQLAVMELLRSRSRLGLSVCISLHDLTLASRYCDRLVLLDRGRLVASGDPSQVLTLQNLSSVYKIRPASPDLTADNIPEHPWRPL